MKSLKRVALLTALCALLLACCMFMNSCGIATLIALVASSKSEEKTTTTTTTDSISETPDTNENPGDENNPEDEKPESIKDKIVSAIDKLSEVSYVMIPASMEMKQSASGSTSTNTEDMTVIVSKDDKNYKTLLSMYQGDSYYAHSYIDGTEMYNANKDDYVDEETGEESEVEYYRSATNKKMTFQEIINYSDMSQEMFMLCVFRNNFAEKISNLVESTENIELTTNADGITKIVIPTDVVNAISRDVLFSEASGLGDTTDPDNTPEAKKAKVDPCCD